MLRRPNKGLSTCMFVAGRVRASGGHLVLCAFASAFAGLNMLSLHFYMIGLTFNLCVIVVELGACGG